MFGEFFCNIISQDDNFYDGMMIDHHEVSNRYSFVSALNDIVDVDEFRHNPDEWPAIDATMQQLICTALPDSKNIITRTHFYNDDTGIDWDQVVQVRFYCDEEDWLFIMLLGVAKTWLTMPETITMHSTIHTPDIVTEFIKIVGTVAGAPDRGQELIDNIETIMMIEPEMLFLGHDKIDQFVDFKIDWGKKSYTLGSSPTWVYMNPLSLFEDPDRHMQHWQKMFDLTDPLDADVLRAYHSKNLELIASTFGHSYEHIKSNISDYRQFLIDFCQDRMVVLK